MPDTSRAVEALDFDAFYREHAPAVLAYCLRRADTQTAEDAFAETFVVAWRRHGDAPEDRLPWLLGIARRTLANQRRSARRQRALTERLAAEPARGTEQDEPAPVAEALRNLGEADQEVLRLAAWEGLRSPEAARVLGCSPAAYRLRLHRARRRLTRSLAQSNAPSAEANRRLNDVNLETEETHP